jgi:hypothetical protein
MDRAARPTQTQNKTPQHTLARVRNNQRRHRERRRQYIAFLEQKVHHGECLLVEARAKVAQLEADSKYWKDRAMKDDCDVHVLANAQTTAPTQGQGQERGDEINNENGLPKTSDADTDADTSESRVSQATMRPPIVDDESLTTTMSPPGQPQPFIALGSVHFSYSREPSLLPQRCTQVGKESLPHITADMGMDMDMDASQCGNASQGPLIITSCNTYPLLEGESTVPCRYASVLIAQQNIRGTDDDTIRSWLEMSFRRGKDQDEGCRVETASLFALLDFISTA